MKSLRILCGISLALLGLVADADTITSGPFTVDFHPEDRAAAEEGLQYLKEARLEFEPILPLGEDPVHLRIAHNMDEFRGLSGIYAHVGVNGVTRADRNSIVVKSPRLRTIGDDYRGTVRHELVHILLHRNTDTDRLPRWLNEGICMMLANEIRWQSAIPLTRMFLTGQIIPLQTLDSAFRTPGSDRQFGDAYAQALSMTRKLYDELGPDRFWVVIRALNTQSFDDAMTSVGGLPVAKFWQDFNRGLWAVSLITTLRTGSFWGIIAILSILAFCARWVRSRRVIRRWEGEDFEGEPDVFDWDHVLDDADAWKRGPDSHP